MGKRVDSVLRLLKRQRKRAIGLPMYVCSGQGFDQSEVLSRRVLACLSVSWRFLASTELFAPIQNCDFLISISVLPPHLFSFSLT